MVCRNCGQPEGDKSTRQNYAEIGFEDDEKVSKVLRLATLFIKAHFNDIPDLIIFKSQQKKKNRNTRELFYTEYDQRISSTRKGGKIHSGPL